MENVASVRAGLDDADNYRVQVEADFDGKELARQLTPFLEEEYEKVRTGDREAFQTFAGDYADQVIWRSERRLIGWRTKSERFFPRRRKSM